MKSLLSVIVVAILLVNLNATLIQETYTEYFCKDRTTLVAGVSITVCGSFCTFVPSDSPVDDQKIESISSPISFFYLPTIQTTLKIPCSRQHSTYKTFLDFYSYLLVNNIYKPPQV
ncbi:MAG: hypothetical protein ACFHWX_04290 [Bacteroidota bacterium]